MKQRMLSLINEMNKNIYEKDSEISLSLLAAIAGESIILLGPPGVAKSMVARRLKSAFRNARSFEYLMSSVEMVFADHNVFESEIIFCRNIAIKLGFKKSIIDYFIENYGKKTPQEFKETAIREYI